MPAFDPSNIDVEDFLDCLDIRNVSRATAAEFRFSCPFPGHDNGDENASSYMNEETTAFFCHGCKASGNAVHFTQRVLGISPLEAIRMLKERANLTVLMSEQNFTQAVRIADRGYVIVHGKIAFEGKSADELNNNELIRKFYMGL